MTADTSSHTAALSRLAIFAGLSEAALHDLSRAGQQRTWPAGAMLFQHGDAGDHMIGILQGRVRISLGTAEGRELILRDLAPGEVLGELALLDAQTRSADARVIAPCTGIVIRRADFLRVAAQHAEIGLALARHLSGLLRDTNYQMESIALHDLRTRVVRFFLFSIRQVYGDDVPATATIRPGFNQTDLSAVLGASRPKVNRVIQDLLAEGLIRRDGDTVICDVARLQDVAAEGADD